MTRLTRRLVAIRKQKRDAAAGSCARAIAAQSQALRERDDILAQFDSALTEPIAPLEIARFGAEITHRDAVAKAMGHAATSAQRGLVASAIALDRAHKVHQRTVKIAEEDDRRLERKREDDRGTVRIRGRVRAQGDLR